jgi:nicotinamide riboside kinase
MDKVFCFVGVSGTGKTTLLNYIKDKFNIDTCEVSARDFLPKDIDYINGSNERLEVLISQHRFLSIVNSIINKKVTVFSRSPIDSASYQMALNTAPFLEPLLFRQIQEIRNKISYIYIPIEFTLAKENDVVRGNDEIMRQVVDNYIHDLFRKFDISYTTVKGTVEQRCKLIDKIFKNYKKRKK